MCRSEHGLDDQQADVVLPEPEPVGLADEAGFAAEAALRHEAGSEADPEQVRNRPGIPVEDAALRIDKGRVSQRSAIGAPFSSNNGIAFGR